MNKIINGDAIEELKKIDDKSIDLILIDPPYNINKAKWDTWKTVEDYIEFMGKVFKEIERVMKDNGSFYFFHNDFLQIVELQNYINNNTEFVFKNMLIWDKPNFRGICWKNPSEKSNLRSWFQTSEYIFYYTFQDETGRKKIDHDINNYKSLREYSKSLQNFIGLNKKGILEKVGQKADHFFRHSSSQFLLPKKETYQELINVFKINEYKYFKTYESLRKEYESLRKEYESLRKEYESLRYTHNLDKNHNDIFRSNKSNSGKLHPTEKPQDILERLIKTSSNEGDVILDCFAGSGSTGLAAKNLNRKYILIEKDEKYFKIIKDRLK